MSGIEIFDVASGKRLVSIRSALLSYDPQKFSSENPLDALDVLTISGVVIDYDAVKDNGPVEKILSLVENMSSGDSDGGFALENLNLPF